MSQPAPTIGQPAPVSIHADRAAGRLELGWPDGHTTVYDTTTLRWLCPCAFCRGEAGMPGWLDSGPTLTADQTRLVDVALVGGYAMCPTWGDGHHTGYYTYALLPQPLSLSRVHGTTRRRPSRGANHRTTWGTRLIVVARKP